MKKSRTAGFVLTLLVLFSSYSLLRAETVATYFAYLPIVFNEAAAEIIIKRGAFVDADSAHQGTGSATIYESSNGQRRLDFEEFQVTNGPGLYVILSKHPRPTDRNDMGSDYVDLGSIKRNVGSQSYDIPADLDLSDYQSVVIYCMPFHVVFSTATLDG